MKNIFFHGLKNRLFPVLEQINGKLKNENLYLSPWVPSGIPCIYVYEIISASADSLHWAPILEDGLKMEANNH